MGQKREYIFLLWAKADQILWKLWKTS